MESLDQKLFGEQDYTYSSLYDEPPGNTRRYGTGMTMLIRPDLTILNHEMSFPAGDILIAKQELAEQPAIISLIFELKKRLHEYQHKINGLELRC
jgi:hypothetical protein